MDLHSGLKTFRNNSLESFDFQWELSTELLRKPFLNKLLKQLRNYYTAGI